MIRFGKEKVLLLHRILIEQTGGEDGVRDMGLLESALAACGATFDGKELFPSKEEKAARLCTGLVSNSRRERHTVHSGKYRYRHRPKAVGVFYPTVLP